MGPCMKDGGRITRPTEKEDSFMPMATCMTASGRMTKLMVTVFTVIWTEPSMRGIGKRTSSMEKA